MTDKKKWNIFYDRNESVCEKCEIARTYIIKQLSVIEISFWMLLYKENFF